MTSATTTARPPASRNRLNVCESCDSGRSVWAVLIDQNYEGYLCANCVEQMCQVCEIEYISG